MIKEYSNLDEIAKKYALTEEQLLDYLLLNNIEILSNLNTIDLNDKDIATALKKINVSKKYGNHTNLTSLESIEIKGLFGKYNYLINFKNDISIWVSENGIGKTTILNIIVAILTGDQNALAEINFKEVIIKISGESYIISKEQDFQVNYKERSSSKKQKDLFEELLMYVPKIYYMKLKSDFENKKYIDLDFLERFFSGYFSNPYSIKNRKVMHILHELRDLQYKKLEKELYKIKIALEEDILFYPTYRRVEVGLNKVFLNYQERYNRDEVSLRYMGFGMDDVKNRINNMLNKMRKDANSAYIQMNANIISELLKQNIKYYILDSNYIDIHKVDVIIKRIGEERIENIDSLKNFISNSNCERFKYKSNMEFLLYYLQKLMEIYDKQEPLDSKLKKFADVCTKYLSGKKIVYDEALLTMDIYDYDNEKIDFEDLSSGEKQVISIFSKVYLDVVTPCIFIIDEPEISLSIEWQKEFLKDIFDSEKIGLMIVTTHSPFIFKNEYREFVIELEKYKEA